MKTVYKKELHKNYMIIEKPQSISEFAVNMLMENEIPGLLPFEKRSFNGEENYYYDISGKRSLEHMVEEKPLKEGDVRNLLESLLLVIRSCRSYFLDISGLVLNFSTIFETEGFYSFCYYPQNVQEQIDMEEKIQTFGENLIRYVDHEDDEAVSLVYEFYTMAKEDTLTIIQIIKQLLEKVREEVPQQEMIMDKAEEPFFEKEAPTPETNAKEETSFETKPDYLTMSIFIILAAGSIGYFVNSYVHETSISLAAELSRKEGLLAAAFLILSVPGVLLSLMPVKFFWKISNSKPRKFKGTDIDRDDKK